ncbi:MAG: shikimate kinase [Planctomycetales bacterium]|nr:shikimate kinase [Planctomycetales bacterium]
MNTDRIYLTGYRGTGKTTVGRLVAQALSTECVDLDQVIEDAAGKSIRQIFDTGGEHAFRDWKTQCLRQVAGNRSGGRVVSLGGGAILRGENRTIIRDSGICVWLTATPEVIAQRITSDQTTGQRRPALTALTPVDEIRELLVRREPLYREMASLILETDQKTPPQLAVELNRWLGENGFVS